MFLESNIFWIVLFVIQIIVLNILSSYFHSYLFFLTGIGNKGGKFSQKIYSSILFFGTLVHELSHVIMAAILFVRVKAFNLKSEIVEDKHIKLGSAEVEQVDPFRNSLVGIAPLIFGIIIIYFLASSVNLQQFGWNEFLKLLLISQISNSMFLSKSDTVYIKYVFILFLSLIVIVFVLNNFYQLIDLNKYLNNLSLFLFSNSLVTFMKNLNLIFLFISLFNFFILVILKFLSKYKRY